MPHARSWPRRRILHAGALLPAQSIRSTSANSAVSVGLIGAGGRGTFDANVLIKHTGARLAAICDLFDERIVAAKKALAAENARAYKRYEDLLASEVDAVIIATPVFLHPEHLEAAIQAGKHVYIEKPAAADVEGCKRVMRAADAAGRHLNITFGFQQRYGPGYRKAHALVQSGQLGNLRLAHSHWIKGVNVRQDEQQLPRPENAIERIRQWKHWKETFGDFVVETYCHGVDVLNWFFGAHPEKATASGTQTLIRRGDQRDTCSAVFTYPGGVQATLSGTQIAAPFHRDVAERFYFAGSVVETAREYWKHIRGSKDVLEEREPRDITIDALQEFVRRIREGRPVNTGVSAAQSTLTAILARTAMDLGREVAWKEVAG